MPRSTLNVAIAVLCGVHLAAAGETVAPTAATGYAPSATAPPAVRTETEGEPQQAQGVAFLVLPIASDEEGLGEQVRQMLRAKARRLGAVVYDPSSVTEALAGETLGPDVPTQKLAELARQRFKADVAVIGQVRGKGPYDVQLRAVYTDEPSQVRVFEKSYVCSHHQVIPLQMARAVYEILGLEQPQDPLRMLREDPEVQRRWQTGPNLVKNPGFEEPDASGRSPAHWQELESQMAWVANPDGPGKVLKFDMDEATAGGYGLDFYSDWIPIEPGATYRFSCRYKTLGPTPKIFLKGYHQFAASGGYEAQRRETYRRQVHPAGPKGQWNTVTADFVPVATRPDQMPTFLKVDLYAYWPKGVIYWDDVVLKKVRDAPAAGQQAGAVSR